MSCFTQTTHLPDTTNPTYAAERCDQMYLVQMHCYVCIDGKIWAFAFKLLVEDVCLLLWNKAILALWLANVDVAMEITSLINN